MLQEFEDALAQCVPYKIEVAIHRYHETTWGDEPWRVMLEIQGADAQIKIQKRGLDLIPIFMEAMKELTAMVDQKHTPEELKPVLLEAPKDFDTDNPPNVLTERL